MHREVIRTIASDTAHGFGDVEGTVHRRLVTNSPVRARPLAPTAALLHARHLDHHTASQIEGVACELRCCDGRSRVFANGDHAASVAVATKQDFARVGSSSATYRRQKGDADICPDGDRCAWSLYSSIRCHTSAAWVPASLSSYIWERPCSRCSYSACSSPPGVPLANGCPRMAASALQQCRTRSGQISCRCQHRTAKDLKGPCQLTDRKARTPSPATTAYKDPCGLPPCCQVTEWRSGSQHAAIKTCNCVRPVPDNARHCPVWRHERDKDAYTVCANSSCALQSSMAADGTAWIAVSVAGRLKQFVTTHHHDIMQ